MFEGTGQKIEKIDDKSVRVILDQSTKKKKFRIDLKPFLSASVYLDTDDLLIQKLAKKEEMRRLFKKLPRNLPSLFSLYDQQELWCRFCHGQRSREK